MKLEDIAKVYPSVFVEYEDGTQSSISFEWFEQNSSSVKLIGYKLILFSKDAKKEEMFFNSKEEMFDKMKNLLTALEKLKKS